MTQITERFTERLEIKLGPPAYVRGQTTTCQKLFRPEHGDHVKMYLHTQAGHSPSPNHPSM